MTWTTGVGSDVLISMDLVLPISLFYIIVIMVQNIKYFHIWHYQTHEDGFKAKIWR